MPPLPARSDGDRPRGPGIVARADGVRRARRPREAAGDSRSAEAVLLGARPRKNRNGLLVGRACAGFGVRYHGPRHTDVTTGYTDSESCAAARARALHRSVGAPRAARRVRRARRLGKNHAAKAVQDLAEIRRLRRRHDEVELVRPDQTAYQEPE